MNQTPQQEKVAAANARQRWEPLHTELRPLRAISRRLQQEQQLLRFDVRSKRLSDSGFFWCFFRDGSFSSVRQFRRSRSGI
ncbi:MAG: hypothetical protein ACLSE8_09180 [Parasutterella sp.]